MSLGAVLAALILATAAEVGSAPSSPQRHRQVVDLAYVLGEAHALHRVCAGDGDNTWRGRMSRLLTVEAPDAAFRQQLMTSFNAGFVARNAEFPTCTVKSAEAERKVAAQGRDLSRRLAAGVSP